MQLNHYSPMWWLSYGSVFYCLLLLPYKPALATSQSQDDISSIYAAAFGKQTALPGQLDLGIKIGKKEVGSIKAFSDDKKVITHVESDAFLNLLSQYLKSDLFDPLFEQTSSDSRIALSTLKQHKIDAHFNQNDLSIDLHIPSEMRTPIAISLNRSTRRRTYPADSELAEPAIISGYVNLSNTLDYDHEYEKDRRYSTAESVLNVKGVVIENQNSWRNDRTDELSRDYTRITVDRPESLHRYTMGDISTERRNYQHGIPLGGIRFEKNTSLDPYLNTRSASHQTFRLEQDSEVKIYVNDFFKAKKNLDAGEYTLNDLNLESGSNNILLEITNSTGNTSTQSFSLLNDHRLLQPGFSNYSITAGKPAYRVDSEYEYDKDSTVISGHFERGINDKLTAGGSVLTDGDNTQVGVNAILPTPIGGVTAKTSVVKSEDTDAKYAAGIHYQYSSPQPNRDSLQFSVSGDYYEQGFSSLNYSTEEKNLKSFDSDNNTRSRVYVSMGKTLGDRLTGSMSVQQETYHDDQDAKYSASIGLRKSFKNGSSISTRVRYQNTHEKDKSFDVNLHVPVIKESKISRYHTLNTSYNSIDDSMINRYFISPKSNTGIDSLAGSLTHYERESSRSINANVSYRSQYAELGAYHGVSQSKQTDKTKQRTKLKLNTAVSFADGQFAVSKPIKNSFAIVEGPDNQDKTIAVMRGKSTFTRSQGRELPDRYQGLINHKGSPAVLNLPNYRYNTVNVDSTALPRGSDPDATEFEVRPAYRQGYRLKAGGELGLVVDGVLVNQAGQPMPLEGGQLLDESKDKTISFFTNSAGKFRLISVPPGEYQLELFNHADTPMPKITVPNDIGVNYNIGKLVIP